jgi:hypothetical protein
LRQDGIVVGIDVAVVVGTDAAVVVVIARK